MSPKAVFIDGTHIKANANTKKQMKEVIPVTSKHYAQELMAEVNADREAHGKAPFDDDDEQPPQGGKRCENTSRKKQARRKKEKQRTITRSDPKVCAHCPTRHLCTHSKDCVKTVQRHIWKDYEELADDARYTPEYMDLYRERKEKIERVFADAKEKHAMRFTRYRGLRQVTNWVRLKFVAMNLKKLARWRWNDSHSTFRYALFLLKTRILRSRIRVFRQSGHPLYGWS